MAERGQAVAGVNVVEQHVTMIALLKQLLSEDAIADEDTNVALSDAIKELENIQPPQHQPRLEGPAWDAVRKSRRKKGNHLAAQKQHDEGEYRAI
jgi:hypothetical protein